MKDGWRFHWRQPNRVSIKHRSGEDGSHATADVECAGLKGNDGELAMQLFGSRLTFLLLFALLIISAFTARTHGQSGACCFNDLGSPLCADTDETGCADIGGCWLGPGSACATSTCQVAEWSMGLDDGAIALQLEKFDTNQDSRILERLAARIDVLTTQQIAMEILPERRTCLTPLQTRVDIRLTVEASAPALNLFPVLLPLDLDSGFPWLPGLAQPRFCGDPADPCPVICPSDVSPGGNCPPKPQPPSMCDYGGDFSHFGTDSFLATEGQKQFDEISHDGAEHFEILVSGDAYFLPYASLTSFTNSVNDAEGVVIVGYGYRIVTGACCLGDGACQILTRPDCTGTGGIYQGDEFPCDVPNLCMGACCLFNLPCQVTTADECFALNGSFVGTGTDCEAPTGCQGACCLDSGDCLITTEEECTLECGSFLGDGTECPFICLLESKFACCLPDGTCAVICPVDCDAAGGLNLEPEDRCIDVDCPDPIGACCLADGSCVESTEASCASMAGIYHGHGSQCETTSCPQPATGACCLVDGACFVSVAIDCAAQNGIYQGDNVPCDLDLCPLPCPADFDGSGAVDVIDLFIMLDAWGPCAPPCTGPCECDIGGGAGAGGDCNVDIFDLFQLLAAWGDCP